MLAKKYKGNVIVRHPLIKEIILYTKGADSAILSVLAKKYKGKVIFVIHLLKKLSCTPKVLTRRFSVCLPRNIKVRRHPLTKENILYTKGADSAILTVLSKKYKGKVIVRHPLIKEIILYTKSADSAILSVLAKK